MSESIYLYVPEKWLHREGVPSGCTRKNGCIEWVYPEKWAGVPRKIIV